MLQSVVALLSLVSFNLQRIENLEKIVAELNSTCQGTQELEARVEYLERVLADFNSSAASNNNKPFKTTAVESAQRLTTVEPTSEGLCPVRYEDKCFFAFLERKVNFIEGVEICESRGGDLANIYSQTHMDDVMIYIRGELGDFFFEDIRLGMKFDTQTKKIYFRDGSEAPAGLKWYRNAPDYEGTSLVLGVSRDASTDFQYLDNQRPEWIFYVLCETGTESGEIDISTTGPMTGTETATQFEQPSTTAHAVENITAPVTSRSQTTLEVTTSKRCAVSYDDKCFFPVTVKEVSYTEGVAICESYGGNLANIYSQNHMDYIMKYIRENRWDTRTNLMYFRLGMKFDPLNEELTLRNGSYAPDDLKWWPNYPNVGRFYIDYTTVILDVNKNPSSDRQYLVNVPPDWQHYNVLCEIE